MRKREMVKKWKLKKKKKRRKRRRKEIGKLIWMLS